jgi:hypothetical protein
MDSMKATSWLGAITAHAWSTWEGVEDEGGGGEVREAV